MRPTVPAVLVALLLAPALAGCVSPADTAPAAAPGLPLSIPADWAARALPFGEGHDHRDWAHHVGLTTANFRELSYDPIPTAYYGNKTAGGHFCGGTATVGERRLAVISSFTTGVAFVVVDVTDAARPQKLGEYVLEHTLTYDVDVTPDGKHVVIAADIGALSPNQPPAAGLAALSPALAPTVAIQPKFRDACTGETRDAGPEEQLPIYPGTVLVSIEDPRSPQFQDFAPAPVIGPHSVSSGRSADNETLVTASTTNLVHDASYFQFFSILDTPAGSKLLPLSTVTSGMYGERATSNGHVDAEIAVHPVTKKTVAYLSNWDGGLVILDMENPRAPVRLSAWADKGTDGGAVHSTLSVEGLWDGKHYVIAGQEFIGHPEDRPSGWIYIIDDTDPAKPREVGRWTLPVDVDPNWGGVELFSTHYFRLVERTLFVTMYHGGVWAVDLSNETALKSPMSVGVFVPDKKAPNGPPAKGTYAFAPFVLDVFTYPDYTMAIFDSLSGLYMVQFDPTNPAPPMPSFTPAPASAASD